MVGNRVRYRTNSQSASRPLMLGSQRARPRSVRMRRRRRPSARSCSSTSAPAAMSVVPVVDHSSSGGPFANRAVQQSSHVSCTTGVTRPPESEIRQQHVARNFPRSRRQTLSFSDQVLPARRSGVRGGSMRAVMSYDRVVIRSTRANGTVVR